MNDSFDLLVNDALNTATVPSAAYVWKRTIILPLILLAFGGLVLSSLFVFYKMHYYCILINVFIFALTFAYGCSFSFRVIYKLVLVSFLPEENIRGVSVYIKTALRKSFYAFMLLHGGVFIASMVFAAHLLLSGFAMFVYFVFTFMSIRLIYSFFLLDAQRYVIPFAGELASKFINYRGHSK